MDNQILVLFGSQTGNSEQTADEIAAAIPGLVGGGVAASSMQLDEFLEAEGCKVSEQWLLLWCVIECGGERANT